MLLSEKVRKYRKENGLTQQQFSDRIGISRQYLSSIEANKVVGNVKLLSALAEHTDLPISYWGDLEVEREYVSLQALDTFLDTLIEMGKVDPVTGEIAEESLEAVKSIMQLELKLKMSK